MNRLVDVEELSVSQKLMVSKMLDAEGLCACGAPMTRLSAKFILGNLVSEHPTDKKKRGGLIMAAYCMGCFTRINNLLRAINENRNLLGR